MKTTLLLLLATLPSLAMAQDSLLTTQPETPAQRTAREVLSAPRQTRDVLLNQLNDAVCRLWDASDPQAVLDQIGTKGRALFEINTQFAQMLVTMMQAQGDLEGLTRLQAIQSKVPPCTIHPDGTVTINPPEDPFPH